MVCNRLTPQSALFTAVPECASSQAPPAPEMCRRKQEQFCQDRLELEEQDQQRRQDGIEANPPWKARERTLIKVLENFFEKCQKIQVRVSEMKYFCSLSSFLILHVDVVSVSEFES